MILTGPSTALATPEFCKYLKISEGSRIVKISENNPDFSITLGSKTVMLPYAVPIQNQSNNNLNWESKYLLQIDNIQTVPLNHQDSSITTFITKLMLHQS